MTCVSPTGSASHVEPFEPHCLLRMYRAAITMIEEMLHRLLCCFSCFSTDDEERNFPTTLSSDSPRPTPQVIVEIDIQTPCKKATNKGASLKEMEPCKTHVKVTFTPATSVIKMELHFTPLATASENDGDSLFPKKLNFEGVEEEDSIPDEDLWTRKVTDGEIPSLLQTFGEREHPYLNLSESAVTSEQLSAFCTPSLRFLNLSSCKMISNFSCLQKSPLEYLDLSHSPIVQVDVLRPIVSLICLSLSDTSVETVDVRSMKDLINLSLRNTQIKNNTFHLPNSLHILDLENCSITDVGLAHLVSMHHLGVLTLSKCKVTDAGIALLALLSITVLILKECHQVRGTFFTRTPRVEIPFGSLRYLDLSCSRGVTEDIFTGFPPSLEILNLLGCTSVSEVYRKQYTNAQTSVALYV